MENEENKVEEQVEDAPTEAEEEATVAEESDGDEE